ncbi:MAG: TonB family protein [Acidobacteria bacterium]|nr:TonB family protein [Acidobacteriota bacterium]
MLYRTHSHQLFLTLALMLAAFTSQPAQAQTQIVDKDSPIYITARVFQLSAPQGKYQEPSDQIFRVPTANYSDEAKWMTNLKKTYPGFTPALLLTATPRVFRTSKTYSVKVGQMGFNSIEVLLNGAQSIGDGVTPGTTLVAEVNQNLGDVRAVKPMTFAIHPIEVESGKTYFFVVRGLKLSGEQYVGYLRKDTPAQSYVGSDVLLLFALSVELERPVLPARYFMERDSVALQKDAAKKVEPVIPVELAQSGLGGKVQVRVEIAPTGKVTNAITHSSSFPEMNEAVIAAARQWEFAPALFAENKGIVSGLLTFEFPTAAAPAKQQSSK